MSLFRKLSSLVVLAVSLLFSFGGLIAQDLIINEILASNQSIFADEDGEFEDWIEIKNVSGSSVNLSGWHLSDDPTSPDLWTFPSVSIAAGDYLMVFASNKDRRVAGQILHTNFQLTSSGEYLGLFRPGQILEHEYDTFPIQFGDVSWGTANDSGVLPGVYFDTPTPDAANGSGESNYKAQTPIFSIERGYFTSTFNLAISSPDGLSVMFTTDGSPPDQMNGTLYTGAISISETSNIRAIAFGPGFRDSKIETHTYAFVSDIITQNSLDQTLVSNFLSEINQSFIDLPILSISTGQATPDSLIGSTDRVASMEMIFPDAAPSLQVDMGVAEVGNSNFQLVKKSYRMFFKSEYGPSKLDYPMFDDYNVGSGNGIEPVTQFDQINIRGGSDDGFYVPSAGVRGLYTRNRWMNDTQLRMGQPATHGRFAHLLINGDYFGQFHLHERGTAHHFANYFGGDKCDYDAHNRTAETLGDCGDVTTWQNTVSAAQGGVLNAAVLNYIDPVNLIDYVVLNYHGGSNQNGGFDDFMMGRKRANNEPWRFFSWDADRTWYSSNSSSVNNIPWSKGNGSVRGVYESLLEDPEFRVIVADRTYKHLYNGGALSPEVSKATWSTIESQIGNSLRTEAARWGDGNSIPEWNAWKANIFGSSGWFDDRPDDIIGYMRAYTHSDHPNGIYPSNNPPLFTSGGTTYNQYEGAVGAGFQLTINNTPNSNQGTIYYTIDDSDPRAVGGGIQGTNGGDSQNIIISGTVTVNARIRRVASGVTTWSALQTATFFAPQMLDELVINEIHYHPTDAGTIGLPDFVDGDEFEFVEIKNTSGSTLQLQGVAFTEGIEFTFPAGSTITAGGFVVLAENAVAFQTRYGFSPTGQFTEKLANTGERLILSDFAGVVLDSLSYGDSGLWVDEPDGEGPSLSLIPSAGVNNTGPTNWYSSTATHGSPLAENVVNFEPIVSITSPSNGQRYDPGQLFSISASASDANDTIDSVRVDTGTLDIGTDETDPYAVSWTPPPGEYYIQAKAWDTYGARGESDLVHIIIATANACSGVDNLVINEINYNDDNVNGPLAGDWIEIYNPNTNEIVLSGWTFKDAKDENYYVVPGSVSIPAYGYHVLVASDLQFSTVHGISNKSGDFSFGLDGSGDYLRLYSPSGCLVDEVSYDDIAPWPVEADGQGPTLELVNPAGNNDDASNWQASGIDGGTPGEVNSGLEITIDLLTPANNVGLASGSTVSVTARVISGPQVSSVDVKVDGIVVGQMTQDGGDPTLYTYDLSGLPDGVFNIELKATNASGLFDTSNASVICIGFIGTGLLVESGGQVVFEAETFNNYIERGTDVWETSSVNDGFVGSSYMVTAPDDGSKVTSGYATTVSELQYLVDFTTTGTYYLLYRGWADSGNNNSVHFGIDGQETTTLVDVGLGSSNYGSWWWGNTIDDLTRARFTISTPGIHTINLWMREDGTNVDRVVLTTDVSLTLTGEGPEESLRQIQKIQLNAKLVLSGAWTGSEMQTSLNSSDLIPDSQPYSSLPAKSVSPTFFDNNPDVVDWVWVEFRTGTAANTALGAEAFLIKKDGTLVNTTGGTTLGFGGISDGDYYVVIGHRNHLSVMSASALTLTFDNATILDFSASLTAAYQVNSAPMRDLGNGVFGLWQGDVNSDGQVKYTGASNDRALVLTMAGGPGPFDSTTGYQAEDVNMDGVIKYTGANNDRVDILSSAGGPTAFDSRLTQVPN